MDARRRMQALHLMDMLQRNPAYAKALEIEIIMQKLVEDRVSHIGYVWGFTEQ